MREVMTHTRMERSYEIPPFRRLMRAHVGGRDHYDFLEGERAHDVHWMGFTEYDRGAGFHFHFQGTLSVPQAENILKLQGDIGKSAKVYELKDAGKDNGGAQGYFARIVGEIVLF